jgi:proteic killer suppression protein
MITGFKDKETEKVWKGSFSKKLPNDIQQQARRKLRMLNSAQNLNDLRAPPSNHLEKLSGESVLSGMARMPLEW